jgi:hypothetical protein
LLYAKTLLYCLILAHFVADYVLQPRRLAEAKRESLPAMLLHGFIVFATAVFFSYFFLSPWLVVGIFFMAAFHVGVDISRARRVLARGDESLWLTIVDQVLHLFSLVVLVYFYPSETINKLGMQNLNATESYLHLLNLVLLTVSGYIFILTGQKIFCRELLKSISLKFIVESEFVSLRTRSASFVSVVEGIASFTLVISGQWELALILALAIFAIRMVPRKGRGLFPYHVFEIVLHMGCGALLGVIVLTIA